jgi:DNA-binding NarL/FixJ family response regulator
MKGQIQVVIVDDHSPLRRGLEILLPRLGFRVTGTAATAEEGSRMIASRRPHVAVLDIVLGEDSGTTMGNDLATLSESTAVVLYTGYADPDVLEEAVGSSALGVVQKTSPVEDLARAIRAAAAGRAYIDPRIAELLPNPGARDSLISKREAEVLGLIAEGLTAEEVATRLFLSPETVHTHVRNAVRKLGARGRLHAVVLALRRGDLEVSGLAVPPLITRKAG